MENKRELRIKNISVAVWLENIREHLSFAAVKMVDNTPLDEMFETFGACDSAEAVNEMCRIDFCDDMEKIADFLTLSEDEFLESYSYLTDDEYKATTEKIIEILTKNVDRV